MLHPIGKQAYKLKLIKKWRIHNIFRVSLLEQSPTVKERVKENLTKLEFDASNSEEYEMEAIRDSAVYAKELEGYLPCFYYLVAWKSYPKKENT